MNLLAASAACMILRRTRIDPPDNWSIPDSPQWGKNILIPDRCEKRTKKEHDSVQKPTPPLQPVAMAKESQAEKKYLVSLLGYMVQVSQVRGKKQRSPTSQTSQAYHLGTSQTFRSLIVRDVLAPPSPDTTKFASSQIRVSYFRN